MREINVLVVDSYGDVEDQARRLVSKYGNAVASWGCYEPKALKGTPFMPHGGQCIDKILAAVCHKSDIKVHVRTVRLFTQQGLCVPLTDDAWKYIGAVCGERETYVNNSWGSVSRVRQPTRADLVEVKQWSDLVRATGARLFFAAGNSGDYDVDDDHNVPQAFMSGDVAASIGSADRYAVPSSFSSDSRSYPPVCVMWAEDIVLFNAARGVYSRGSGTSFAAPKAVAVAAANGWTVTEFNEAAADGASRPGGYTKPLPNPKWGYGWFEPAYQRLVCGSPYLYRKRAVMSSATDEAYLDSGEFWFDMNMVTASELVSAPCFLSDSGVLPE